MALPNIPRINKVSASAGKPMAAVGIASQSVNITTQVVAVTPEMASKWLEGKGPNRRVSDRQVSRYVADMKSGRWHLNGEAIVFSEDGALLDGQHRLWAVVLSGCTVLMLIVNGVNAASMATFDMGKSRIFADVLHIEGVNCVATQVAAGAARLLWWYDNGCHGSARSIAATHADLQESVDKHPLIFQCADVANNSKARRFIVPSMLCFLLTLGVERNAERTMEFLKQLEEGVYDGDATSNPVYHLREKMIADRGSRKRLDYTVAMAYGIKSLRAFLRKKPLKVLKHGRVQDGTEMEAFPRMEG